MSLIPMLIHVNSYLFFWFSWVSKWKVSFLWIDQRASRRNSSAPVMSWQRSGWCVMKAIYYAGPGARCTQLSKEKLSLIQVVVYNYPYLFGNRQDHPLDHPQHLRLNNTNSIPISWYAHYRIWLPLLLECVYVTLPPSSLVGSSLIKADLVISSKDPFLLRRIDHRIHHTWSGDLEKNFDFEYDSIHLLPVILSRWGKLI